MDHPQIAGIKVEAQDPDRVTQWPSLIVASPKIGGWLIVIAVGLIFSLTQNLTNLLSTLEPLSRDNVWARLTDPASTAYHPYWGTVMIYDAVTAIFFVVANIVLVILFFKKKRLFPKITVAVIPLIFILSVVGYYFSSLIPAITKSPIFAKQGHDLILRFVSLHIWIPYFLVSKRVKQTFIF